jgi:hypothetical protein
MKSVLTSAQWVNALEAVNVAINAAGKYGSVRSQAGWARLCDVNPP